MPSYATAVFGAGCFWCTEAIFTRLKGVVEVIPGYAGGTTEKPTYLQVSRGSTGHAEVVKVIFDPQIISYTDLLDVFFSMHDPTTLNRQGADVGTQYRSMILYTAEDQRVEAKRYIQDLAASGKFDSPIVTEVQPLDRFYAAEPFHRDYYAANPNVPYCVLVVDPKIEHLKRAQPGLYREL